MDKVWVLVIEHNQGTNVEVHRTERGAQDSLVTYVDEYWDNVGPWIEDDSERVEFYFDNNDEFYSIQVVEVED